MGEQCIDPRLLDFDNGCSGVLFNSSFSKSRKRTEIGLYLSSNHRQQARNVWVIQLKIIGSVALLYRPPLWSSGQSSWLQVQRSGFDFRRYQMFWEVVSLERGSLSLVSKTDELLGRKYSGSGLENRDYGCTVIRRAGHAMTLSAKVSSNFADKRRSLGRYICSRTETTGVSFSF
jgi:hypothetical protein